MASKQLGKLRQWGKEVISTKDRTTVTEEFKLLEKDVELRKAGIARIQEACSEYYGYLHKKKEYPNVEEGVKMLPIDALGAVMVAHGEEFGSQCLSKFGRAQCKIATLQEAFASFVRDKYLSSLENLLDDIEDYETLRKKLDSRRLTYDAALSKVSKVKKDKDVKEAEEEVSRAKTRYEETSLEVQSRMRRIQANELRQLKDLTRFLENQVQFTTKCLSELHDVRAGWCDEAFIERRSSFPTPVAPHSFSNQSGKLIASVSRKRSDGTSFADASDSSSEESNNADAGTSDGRSSQDTSKSKMAGQSSKTSSVSSRPSSRRASLSSNGTAHQSKADPIPVRQRSNSATSSVASSTESTKRSGVTGWLSGSTRGKKDKDRRRDKERGAMRAFASLENDSGGEEDDIGQKGMDSDSRSNGAANSTTPRKGGTLSRMFNTAQRPLSMNLSIKGSSSNSSFTSFAETRDSHASEIGHNSSLGTKKVKRVADDFNVSHLSNFSSRNGENRTVFSDGEHQRVVDGLSRKKTDAALNHIDDRRTRLQPNPSSSINTGLLFENTTKTGIAQRAELEMQHNNEYEPSINSMDDNIHTPLPTSTYMFTPFNDVHHIKRGSLADGADSASEKEAEENDVGPLFEQDGQGGNPYPSVAFGAGPSSSVDQSMHSQHQSRIEIGNASGQILPRGVPPPLPSRKQSVKKAPPPPPPPPARRFTPSPNIGLTTVGGSSTSLNSSAGVSTSGGTSFPPPPPPRTRNNVIPTDSLTVSPFDN